MGISFVSQSLPVPHEPRDRFQLRAVTFQESQWVTNSAVRNCATPLQAHLGEKRVPKAFGPVKLGYSKTVFNDNFFPVWGQEIEAVLI